MTTSALIRAARIESGLTQRGLAEAAGTSQPAIARYESGRAEPRSDTLERILAACGRRLTTERVAARREQVPAKGPKGRLLRRHHAAVLLAVAKSGLRNPRIFGSVARGDDTMDSDIDILVDLGSESDVLAISELRELLVPLLGDRVDVVCPEILKSAVLESAFAEMVPL